MPYPEELLRIHRKLERFVTAEINQYHDKIGAEIARYKSRYERGLSKKFSATEKNSLVSAMRSSECVLVGDFHTFSQSQKTFLRLLEMYLASSPKERPALALECVQSTKQPTVQKFLDHLISIEELREELDFEHSWPFPWQHYKSIFEFAREKRLPVLALNADPKHPIGELKKRDAAAAHVLSSWKKTERRSKIFVLIGDFHLAKSHLPKALDKLGIIPLKKILLLHQNNSDLFWKLQRKRGLKSEIIRLGPKEFCILNAAPWVKLKTYLDWLEGNPSNEDEMEGIDVPASVQQFAELIKEALHLKTGNQKEIEFLLPEQLHNARNFSAIRRRYPSDTSPLAYALKYKRAVVFHKSSSVLVPFITTNTLAEAAALSVWVQQFSSSKSLDWDDPQSLVMHFFVSYLGSKFINPKRKCNEIVDFKKIAAQRSTPAVRRKVFFEANNIAKKILDGQSQTLSSTLRGSALAESCRLVGFMLADRIFALTEKNGTALKLAKKVFTLPYGGKKWKGKIFQEIARLSRSDEINPVGKLERL